MSSQLELLNFQTFVSVSDEDNFGKPKSNIGELKNHKKTIENALKDIFPTKQEESMLERARRILGDDVLSLSDEDLEKYVREFQELIDFWLDSYEKEIFDNKTLRELIREG